MQVGSQVAKYCKFRAYNWLMRFYNNRLLAINSCRLALGGQTVKSCVYLRPNLSSTKVNASPCKSSQVDASRHKWVAKRNASPKLASTCESVWPGLYYDFVLWFCICQFLFFVFLLRFSWERCAVHLSVFIKISWTMCLLPLCLYIFLG